MKKKNRILQNTTNAATCHWCGRSRNLKPLKISLTKSQWACNFCYSMMNPELPRFEDATQWTFGWKGAMLEPFIIRRK